LLSIENICENYNVNKRARECDVGRRRLAHHSGEASAPLELEKATRATRGDER